MAVRSLVRRTHERRNVSSSSARSVDQASALLESDKNIELLFTEIGLQGDVQNGLMLAQEAV